MSDSNIEIIAGTIVVPEYAIMPKPGNGIYTLSIVNADLISVFNTYLAPTIRRAVTKLALVVTTANNQSTSSIITVQKVHNYRIHYPENSTSKSQLVDLTFEFSYDHLNNIKDELPIQIGRIIQNNKTLAVEFYMGVSDKQTAIDIIRDKYPVIYHMGTQYKYRTAYCMTATIDSSDPNEPVRETIFLSTLGMYYARELPNLLEEDELLKIFRRFYNSN